MSLVTWLNIVTIVARSVHFWPACMSKDVHATRQLHCQSWSGQWHAKHGENGASVHDTCLDKICQGYVPLTLDVVRVAFKVPLAFHTPL